MAGVFERFAFPAHMDLETAHGLLSRAYAKVDAGKVVRATTRRARREGFDPPSDVLYAAQPSVVHREGRMEVEIGSDIHLYEEFRGWKRCLDLFEDEVGRALLDALEGLVRKWVKRHPAPKA